MHAFYICLIEGRRGLKDVLLFSNKEKPIISSSHEELEKIIQNKYFKNFEDWNDNDFLIRCLSFIQRTPRIAKIQRTTAPPGTILNKKIIGTNNYKVIPLNSLDNFTAIVCKGDQAEHYMQHAKIISLTSIKKFNGS